MFKKYPLMLDKLADAIYNCTLPEYDSIVSPKTLTDFDYVERRKYVTQTSIVRDKHMDKFGFAIITDKLVDEIAELVKGKKVVEIGCGSGWLALNIRTRHPNQSWETLDNNSWDLTNDPFLSADHVIDYQNFDYTDYDVVVCSWPTWNGTDIEDVLRKIQRDKYFLMCGEGQGGCTGSDGMHLILTEEFEVVKSLEYSLGFMGIHDTWTLYKRIF